ncbi:MAG TPA: hypothetical protein DCO79_00580 [Spirochaeta sp.]|nr:hypothetical protein [Spirochaeta sp.]
MKKKYRYILFIILISFTNLNAWSEKINLVTDQFWNTMLEAELYRNPLDKFIRDTKEVLRFISSEKLSIEGERISRYIAEAVGDVSDFELIKQIIGETEGIIILSPLYAIYGCELAEIFSERFFIIPCLRPPSECSAGNIAFFVFDYTAACSEAGRWAAGQHKPVFAIFYTADELYKQKNKAFLDGWTSQRDVNELDITEFSKADELSEELLERYRTMVFEDEGLAAVFAGPYNETVLKRFDGGGTKFLSEDLQAWQGADFNAAGTVELSPVKILSNIVKSINADNYRNRKTIKAEFFLYDTE